MARVDHFQRWVGAVGKLSPRTAERLSHGAQQIRKVEEAANRGVATTKQVVKLAAGYVDSAVDGVEGSFLAEVPMETEFSQDLQKAIVRNGVPTLPAGALNIALSFAEQFCQEFGGFVITF